MLQLIKNIEKLPYPEGYYWEYPGEPPSIGVPYGKTRDFFYSGHTGLMVYCWLLYSRRKQPSNLEIIAKYISFVGIWFVMFALLITRVHFSIDIVAAWIFCFWLF